MFNLNDRVVTKRLGEPAIGVVRAIISPQFYHQRMIERYGPDNLEETTQNHYTIEFDDPIKQISLPELNHFFGNKQKAQEAYDSLPKHKFLEYPEEELELWQQ